MSPVPAPMWQGQLLRRLAHSNRVVAEAAEEQWKDVDDIGLEEPATAYIYIYIYIERSIHICCNMSQGVATRRRCNTTRASHLPSVSDSRSNANSAPCRGPSRANGPVPAPVGVTRTHTRAALRRNRSRPQRTATAGRNGNRCAHDNEWDEEDAMRCERPPRGFLANMRKRHAARRRRPLVSLAWRASSAFESAAAVCSVVMTSSCLSDAMPRPFTMPATPNAAPLHRTAARG